MAPPVVLTAVADEVARRSPRHALKYVISAFTSLSPAAARQVERALGVPVVVIYGTTEAGQIAQSPLPPETAPAGSVGWPSLHDVEIRDDGGHRLPAGEVGEIVVRGPEVFSGYEGNEDANRAAIRDDWYRTGDTGYVDRDGFVYLADRITDLVNRGGNKIVPSEIEDVLRKHAGVADAAAFGVPHPTLGQDLAVAVVPREAPLREADLRRFVRSRLASYKLPSRYLVVDELPRTALGKVDRPKLREIHDEARRLTFEEPRDRVEEQVARIFGEVLGVTGIGRSDSFFDLGGDSLRVVSVLQELEKSFGIRPDFEALFDHPTVASFATIIDKLVKGGAAAPSTRNA
jgi:acyl-CoA synthetase (AMP-forming)/AMP-acid ligase II/acyl carrier protein